MDTPRSIHLFIYRGAYVLAQKNACKLRPLAFLDMGSIISFVTYSKPIFNISINMAYKLWCLLTP